jgi:hypothetical protein
MSQAAARPQPTGRVRTLARAILGGVFLAILAGILVAGLWPFNPHPRNKVTWLSGENGIEFRVDGAIFSEKPLATPSSSEEQVSLDLWLQPAIDDTAPIFSFDKRHPAEQFRVLQYGNTLLLQQKKDEAEVGVLEIEHSLKLNQSTFFTITADGHQTSAYVNGSLVTTSTHFILRPADLSGRLIAGSQPFDYDSFVGQLRGFAIYRQSFTADQVLAHYRSWISGDISATANDLDKTVALYRFDEHRGNLIHNAAAAGPNLVIPEAFTILDKRFLDPPWSTPLDRDDYRDIAINIAGFIPLGFFLCAFLHTRKVSPRISPAWAAIIFGSALSLMIEVLQFYLPTRDSSLTDVISNSVGTVIGACLCQLASRLLSARIKPVE